MTEDPFQPTDDSGEMPSLMEMNDKLDSLWVQYLDLIDKYQKAQDELQKQFSAGFFSLAQANFKSPTRRRYGQDYYDERMQARRTCHFTENDTPTALSVAMVLVASPQESTDPKAETTTAKPEQPTQQPSPPSTPAPSSPNQPPISLEKDSEAPVASSAVSHDPLKWFGILVPAELRSAQASFTTAVQTHVVAASNAARGMREIEVEIRRVRKLVRKAGKGSI